MLRIVLLVLLVVVVGALGWALLMRAAPPEVPFTKATRETLVSTLSTNGKVEPIEWVAVRSEASGPVQAIHVQKGQPVVAGQLIVTISASEAQTELAAAQARIAQVQSELQTLESGGRAGERAEIESGVERARAELATANKQVESLKRLVAKKAATQSELDAAEETARRAELQIQALERKRGALVSAPDKSSAQARLREAQTGANAAAQRIASAQVRSPIAGIVYALEARQGAFMNPGDLVANVGQLSRLRVIVYVDEPELGRVREGMPVSITWDAVPGREWKGTVEKVPLQVQPLGTRQVGEVICTIENADVSLLPGTNVNAEIRSSVVNNTVTIPKEALRREGNETGVLKLEGDRVQWRKIRTGVSSITRIQVLEGLVEGDMVALPIDQPIKTGDQVEAVAPQLSR